MNLNDIPEPLLDAVIERFLERSRGTVKRWRRWGMLDLAWIYYNCQGQYHLNAVADACEIIKDRAQRYCASHSPCKEEALFIEQIYTDIEIENMRIQ